METIVVFFSRAEENFINGQKEILLIGNTKQVAYTIHKKLKIPLVELLPVHPYPSAYSAVVDQAKKEKSSHTFIPYRDLSVDFSKVNTIFLGFPNWWGSYPQIISSFLSSVDLSNKRIYPFCTHEGSAFGDSIQRLAKECPTAKINTGLAIYGSKVNRSDTAISHWLMSYSNNRMEEMYDDQT